MRLFGYYALHTFKNQVRKLLRTWVVVFFLICAVMGGLIGYGAAMLSNVAEENAPETEEIEEEPEESEPLVDPMEQLELLAGGVILLLLVYEGISSDKRGSAIFLPADANLLFPSPMRPQSVLMFRLTTKMGTALLAGIYLVFYVPGMLSSMGYGAGASAGVILGWCMALLIGKLLQVLLYLLGAAHPRVRAAVRPVIYGLLAVILAAFFAFWRMGNETPARAAAEFFCGPVSRWVPVWGWLKGIFLFPMEGHAAAGLLCLVGCLAVSGGMLAAIWRIDADFYEDAMAKSEEIAALQRKAQEGKGMAVRTRKKDWGEGLRRDGLRGWGANVFFYKTLYNRFRFAKWRVFTKTTVTYLLAAVGVSFYLRFMAGSGSLTPVALALGAIAFFRALGNPLSGDTGVDWFRLVPEPAERKLFWSLLGGSVCCLMDLLPGMLAAVVMLGANPLLGLGWLVFIVTVDFYSTVVGTFIDLSVPGSVGKTIKQMIQVMFVYFGLIPDVAIVAIGLATGSLAGCTVIAGGVNVLLGTVFLFLCPRFLEGGGKEAAAMEMTPDILKTAKKRFSRVGLGVFVTYLVGALGQMGLLALMMARWPETMQTDWALWVFAFVPLYLVAVPLGLLVFRTANRAPITPHRPKTRYLLVCIPICFFLMYAGNLIGIAVTSLLQLFLPGGAQNPLESLVGEGSMVLQILVMVILAPCIEEYIFRRTIIDRLHIYGQKRAVILSGLLFGLFHGNLSQFFYAFFLGMAFGYIYLRTGRLRYTVGLHMLVNFLGGIVAPLLVQNVDLEGLMSGAVDPEALVQTLTPGTVVFYLYSALMMNLAVFGLVMLLVLRKKIHFDPAPLELPKGTRFRTAYLNAGMILAFVLLAGVMVYSVLP